MKFDPARPWCIMQSTSKGPRYFLGGYPQHVDSWTPDIRKAARWTSEQVANVVEHCSAYTAGARPRKVHI